VLVLLGAGQTSISFSQATATRDPAAVTLAAQSLNALAGGTSITDLTLQGTVAYVAGSDEESGSATLLASGNLASRVTLSLTNGQRTEIRNGPAGDWIGPDAVEHAMAIHNCWPDAAWFYPGLSFEALSTDPGLGIAYIGPETKNGAAVYHVRLFRVVSSQSPSVTALAPNLSSEDLYLDAASYLPLFLDFNTHPDYDLNRNIPVEIAFSGYQNMSGVQVPTRIQKYLNGSLLLGLTISSAAVNSGLPASNFAVTSTTGGAQ
jgi:hypothetical protein